MHFSLKIFMLVALTPLISSAQKCRPEDNCRAPTCRCWNDPKTPGNLKVEDIPQMVLVSFTYGINSANVDTYLKIFENFKNPNGCPPRGTFFVQGTNTQFDLVTQLHQQGHEIGLTSEDGTIPGQAVDWIFSIEATLQRLRDARIPDDQVKGFRAPDLYFGGDDELVALYVNRLTYDASCVTRNYTEVNTLLWPYTMDYDDGVPACNSGKPLRQGHTGLWEFLLPVMDFEGMKCSSPSGCAEYIKSEIDAMALLYSNFMKHYDGRRTPFTLFIDPVWLSNPKHVKGTRIFFEILQSQKNTWVVTHQQALAWMMNPVTSDKAKDYPPWKCL